MYDAQKLTSDLLATISTHVADLLNFKLFIGGAEIVPNLNPNEPWQAAIHTLSPIPEQIKMLCEVANGNIDRANANDMFVGEVREIIQSVCELLFSTPGSYSYEIPSHFWNDELGEVIQLCQVWLANGELISLTEAATLLYPDLELQTARMRIKRMIERGELQEYKAHGENNPQRETRVIKGDVEKLRDE